MKITAPVFSVLKGVNDHQSLTLKIQGQCMEPVLDSGSEAVVSHKRFYLPGDIIVFRRQDGELVVHRLLLVYWKNGVCKVLAKADRSHRSDAAVACSEILGRIDVETGVSILIRLKSLTAGLFVLLRRLC
jgi:hypothetical protein